MGFKSQIARAIDALLAAAGFALTAVLIAVAAAVAVLLLPGKLAVFLIGLYGFIAVGLLQAVAAFALLFTLAQAVVGNSDRGDAVRGALLCGGFLIAIALLNTYLLQLGALFGKDFAIPAAGVPLIQFIDFDDHILAGAMWAHSWIDHALPAGAMARCGVLGLAAGLVLAAWMRLAKGATA